MTTSDHQAVPTQFVTVYGIRFAYRRSGKPGGAQLARGAAQLILYPDAGHGSQYQYPELFVSHVSTFLSADGAWTL
jgi:pimeloyl-ACP methyl ester carboxylesterase